MSVKTVCNVTNVVCSFAIIYPLVHAYHLWALLAAIPLVAIAVANFSDGLSRR